MAKVGQSVRYHEQNNSNGTIPDASYAPFVVAAIVTMTPEEWQPGYREADGTWVAQTTVAQPKDGCVHLQIFPPPSTVAWKPEDLIKKDVPLGNRPGAYELLS